MALREKGSRDRRVRELASRDRAGTWARSQALKRQYQFARRAWWVLLITGLSPWLMAPLLLFVDDSPRMFFLGALTTTSVAVVVHLVVTASGAAARSMGGWAESWTADELKRAQRRGWRVIHRAVLSFGDIDHVAIGAPGLVVLETKWSADAWSSRRQIHLDRAVAQASLNAQRVRNFVRSVTGAAPTYSAVVLWSAEPSEVPYTPPAAGETQVVLGHDLRRWLSDLHGDALEAAAVERAWSRIEQQTGRRDEFELAKHGPPPKSPAQYAADLVQVVVGLLAGAFVTALLLQRMGENAALALSLTACFVGAGWWLRRTELLRTFAAGWVAGAAAMTGVVAGIVILSATGVID